jgi:hypothetical protein
MNAELVRSILVSLNLSVMVALLAIGTTMGILIAREILKALANFTLHRRA